MIWREAPSTPPGSCNASVQLCSMENQNLCFWKVQGGTHRLLKTVSEEKNSGDCEWFLIVLQVEYRVSSCNCYKAKKTLKTTQETIQDTHWAAAQRCLLGSCRKTIATHARISHEMGNRTRTKMSPERVSWSFFLHLYLISHSQPVLNAETSGRTTQSTTPFPSGEGGRWCGWQMLRALQPVKPFHQGPGGCGTGQEDFITQRSMPVQDMSLRMLSLWKCIFLLTNQFLTGFLLKQQPPPGQVNVTVAAVSFPRGLPASRIQLDPFVCKCFKYFSWYAIKE